MACKSATRVAYQKCWLGKFMESFASHALIPSKILATFNKQTNGKQWSTKIEEEEAGGECSPIIITTFWCSSSTSTISRWTFEVKRNGDKLCPVFPLTGYKCTSNILSTNNIMITSFRLARLTNGILVGAAVLFTNQLLQYECVARCIIFFVGFACLPVWKGHTGKPMYFYRFPLFFYREMVEKLTVFYAEIGNKREKSSV